MEKSLRAKQLGLSLILEGILLAILRKVIMVLPFPVMIFLPVQAFPMIIAVMVFVAVRLLVFLLCAWNTEWYRESRTFILIRLGARKFQYRLLFNTFLSSALLHLVLAGFCGEKYLLAAVVQSIYLTLLFFIPKWSSRKSYPVLFVFYLAGCLVWNSCFLYI